MNAVIDVGRCSEHWKAPPGFPSSILSSSSNHLASWTHLSQPTGPHCAAECRRSPVWLWPAGLQAHFDPRPLFLHLHLVPLEAPLPSPALLATLSLVCFLRGPVVHALHPSSPRFSKCGPVSSNICDLGRHAEPQVPPETF